MISDTEHLLMSMDHLYVLFGEVSIQVFAHFVIGLFVFFLVELYKFLRDFGY